jgi:lipoate synthase
MSKIAYKEASMATVIPERRPVWLKVRPPQGENYEQLKQLMQGVRVRKENVL